MADYDSQAGSNAADTGPIARPDVDALPAGSFGPASGNAITGTGTVTGAAGADTPGAAPASIVEVHGAGGASSESAGNFQANGQYGVLSMDNHGNYNYVRNPGTPDGVKDVFGYTLADAQGARSPSTLTIDIGQVATAAADGIVNLPAGVELSDVHVVGRDLVIDMPDGTQMVIAGGAVFVPQLVIGDVAVPPSNVAALLIDAEPQPAAGPPQSSGGNFAAEVPPLDPGVPLGDLIPPTELNYTPPDFNPEGQFIDTKPTVIIETPDNPAGAIDAHDQVDEAGLPARTIDGIAEPQGSDAASDSEGTSGTIVFEAKDGLESVTVNGVVVTADSVGDTIQGEFGTLTITGVNLANGQITYTYAISDNTDPGGNGHADHFTVVVTDSDGDAATGTLTVDIIDDTPTANNDTDSVDVQTHEAAGNVITAAGTTNSGADVVGADDAHITGLSSNNVAGHSDSDASGGFVVDGEFGTLTMDAEGQYTYVLHENAPGGSTDVFTYTLTDGDGDPSTATLTINNPDQPVHITNLTPQAQGGDVIVDEDDLQDGSDTSKESTTVNGTFNISAPDGVDDLDVGNIHVIVNGVFQVGATGVTPLGNTLTITGYDAATGVVSYSYTLLDNETHASGGGQNSLFENFTVTLTDTDGDSDTNTLSVQVVDDVPTANPDTDELIGNDLTEGGNVITGVGTTSSPGGIDVPGADGAHVTGIDGADGSTTTFVNGVLTIHGDFGTLEIDANGEYTYTRDADSKEAGTDTFHYTITDGDGDPSTSTLTITLPDINSVPEIGRAEPLAVDEDGLPAGNSDDGQSNPTEAAHGGNLTDDGQVVVDFGNDRPADLTGSIEFVNPSNLDGQLTQGGQPITFSIDGSGNLIGQVNGVGPAVVTLSLTTAVNGAGGTVTYGYDVTLAGNVDQANADQTEDGIVLTGVQFNVTDSDGEHAATPGSFDVTIYDDVPSADDVNVTQDPENSAVTVDISGHIVPGADGVDLHDVTHSAVSGGTGTLDYDGDTGIFTYTPTAGEEGTVTFTYTVTDGDGDHITKTVTIDLADDSTPQIGEAPTLTVDEDGLPAGNADNSQVNPTEANHGGNLTDSDTVVVDFGNDRPASPGDAIEFINASNLDGQLTQDGQPITFSIDGSGHIIGQVNGVGAAVVTLSLTTAVNGVGGTVTYGYSVTLAGNVDQANADQTEAGITLTGVQFQVTDSDGDVSPPGSFNVTIFDDVPSAEDFSVNQPGEDQAVTINITTHIVPGADGVDLADVTHSDPTGTGTLGYDGATGVFTYTPGAGETGDVTFDYTITDGDGDHITKTVTIHLGEDSTPEIGSAPTLTVDEDGLPAANADNSQVNPTEANHGGNVTDSDTVVVDFGNDRPASPGDAIEFINADGLDGQLTQNGQPITFSIDGSGNIIGQVNGVGAAVVTLSLTTAVNGVGGTVTYGYSVTLAGHVDQANADQTEAGITLTGVQFQVTDSDGDVSPPGSFNVTIFDDVPSVDVAGSTTVVEGASTNGTWTEVVGADAPGTTVAVFDGTEYALGAPINTGFGTLTVLANGTWTFQANANIAQPQSISFDVKVTDSDGDHMSDTQTISITDGAGPGAGGTVNLTVNEFALDTTKDANDIAAGISTGTNSSATSETQVVAPASGLSFTTGSDSLTSVAFNGDASALSGIVVSGLQAGQSITWAINGSGQLVGTLHEGATNLGTAIIVALTGDTGATAQGGTAHVGATATLVGPLDHTNTSITLNGVDVIASQADGDVGHGTVNVTVSDDVPVLGTIQPIESDNNPTDTNGTIHDGQGSLHLNSGADGFGTVLIEPDLSTITVGQHAVFGEMTSATVYTAYADLDDSGGISAGDTAVFTITANPAGGTTGTWTFDLLQALDPDITPFNIGAGSSFGVGPSDSVVVTDDASGLNLVFVTGFQPTDGFTGGEETAWLGGGIPDVTQNSNVNGSTAGWGLFNNNFDGPGKDPGEFMRFDFGTLNDYDAGGPYTVPVGAPTIENVAFATFSFANFGDGDTIEFVAHYTDGTTEDFVLSDGEAATLTITAPAGAEIAWIDAYESAGSIKLNLDQVGVFSSTIDKTIPVDFTFTDGDGDQVTGSSSIHVTDGGTATTPNALVNQSMMLSTQDVSHTLVNSNDNNLRGNEDHRAFNNAALLGAIAGAGLSSATQVAAESHHVADFRGAHSEAVMAQGHSLTQFAVHDQAAGQSVSGQLGHGGAPAHDMVVGKTSLGHDTAKLSGLAGHEQSSHPAFSQLSEGTKGADHGEGHASAQVTAAAIVMPSAQQLAGLAHNGDGVQHVEGKVVAQVLSDALQGGAGHGPNLDALINALPGHGGHGNPLEALASHGDGAVSFGHSGGFAGFTSGHGAPIMEIVMMHQDAPAHV